MSGVAQTALLDGINGFSAHKRYIYETGDMMPGAGALSASSTAALIQQMAARYKVAYVPTRADLLANDMSHLADDTVKLDEVECLLIALQRAGHISRDQLVQLQARYLREANRDL